MISIFAIKMSEDRVHYRKKKYMYLVQDEGRGKKFLFGNIMAAVRWFDAQRLRVHPIEEQYEEIVSCMRSGKMWMISGQGGTWDMVAVEVLGQSVRSSRKAK